MDRSAGFRATDRRAARSIDPPHSHPGDERAKLSAEEQQEDEGIERTIAAGTVQRAAGEDHLSVSRRRPGGCFWRRLPRHPKRAALRASQGDAPAAPPKAKDNGLKEE